MARSSSKTPVELGNLEPNGIAPSLFAMVERGVGLRAALARSMRGTVEIRFSQRLASVRIAFTDDGVLVEDVRDRRSADEPDVAISGSLPDVVQLVSVPTIAGVPRPTGARGRAALASVTSGRVKVEGDRQLARRLVQLLQI